MNSLFEDGQRNEWWTLQDNKNVTITRKFLSSLQKQYTKVLFYPLTRARRSIECVRAISEGEWLTATRSGHLAGRKFLDRMIEVAPFSTADRPTKCGCHIVSTGIAIWIVPFSVQTAGPVQQSTDYDPCPTDSVPTFPAVYTSHTIEYSSHCVFGTLFANLINSV